MLGGLSARWFFWNIPAGLIPVETPPPSLGHTGEARQVSKREFSLNGDSPYANEAHGFLPREAGLSKQALWVEMGHSVVTLKLGRNPRRTQSQG